MMTVSGIDAEGLSANVVTCWIAAGSACPRLIAVLGSDTELCIALIPVISFLILVFSAYKGKQNISSGKKKHKVFACV
jgi:hypothetical protein